MATGDEGPKTAGGCSKLVKVNTIKGQKLPPAVGGFLEAIVDALDDYDFMLRHANDYPAVCLTLHRSDGKASELTVLRTEDWEALRRRADGARRPGH